MFECTFLVAIRYGDSTAVLRALLAAGVGSVGAGCIADPEAAAALVTAASAGGAASTSAAAATDAGAGVAMGATVPPRVVVAIGGKMDPSRGGGPIFVTVR